MPPVQIWKQQWSVALLEVLTADMSQQVALPRADDAGSLIRSIG
jgi:hypothetical protein